tara:strand:+ start:175 stop:1566 length:1392 start_codon:yes stop_codon:yes gene_type:complete
VNDKFFETLKSALGEQLIKTNRQDLNYYGSDWTEEYIPNPIVIVFPKKISQVIKIVKICNEFSISIVPSGGRTGLSGGAVAKNGELVISFEKMNKILDFNLVDQQIVCEPGLITQDLKKYAEEKNLFFPVDFSSAGSSQIGGNVATNAGGIKVIKYGMTRNWIQGLKVVTGSGELLDLNNGLIKNATGYDLRHLFIGSEGTLGIIVEITLKLCIKPKNLSLFFVGLDNMSTTTKILSEFQSKIDLTAFEFFSEKALEKVLNKNKIKHPFKKRYKNYLLIEFEESENKKDLNPEEILKNCLKKKFILDAVVSQNLAQSKNLWALRENISESISEFMPYKNDISVKVSKIPEFIGEIESLVNNLYPDFEIIWFGHIGDGNIHLNILKPKDLERNIFLEKCKKVSNLVYELVNQYDGSISAEHGVGLIKKPYLGFSKSNSEIEYMKNIKKAFDPKNIMNPGKIIDI